MNLPSWPVHSVIPPANFVYREDCYHLSALLPSADSAPVRAEQLDSIFRAFAEKRQPRTKELVRGARAQGERRVVTGGEDACEQRDRAIMASWKDERAIEEKYDSLFREPF
jgi:salicylate hydroxylase